MNVGLGSEGGRVEVLVLSEAAEDSSVEVLVLSEAAEGGRVEMGGEGIEPPTLCV